MNAKEHLPLYGVGPLYGAVLIGLTVVGVVLSDMPILSGGQAGGLRGPMAGVGAVLILCGAKLWFQGAIVSKLDENIQNDKLVTKGAYAYVRNPIYAAILMACTGVLLCAGNFWLLVLPVAFWAFLTVLMKCTEEKWLAARYGAEYADYCARVNRCIPWPPKKAAVKK